MQIFIQIILVILFLLLLYVMFWKNICSPIKDIVKAFEQNPRRFKLFREDNRNYKYTFKDSVTQESWNCMIMHTVDGWQVFVGTNVDLSLDERKYLYKKIAKPLIKRYNSKVRARNAKCADRKDKFERDRLTKLYRQEG